MARSADAPSRMEILILTALERTPMHGYELKLELRYKHVEWWAKCDHGHLYATLDRLEKRRFIRRVAAAEGRASRRVFAITDTGRRRVRIALEHIGSARDATYFELDLFLNGAHLLDRREVLAILERRLEGLRDQLAEAVTLERNMSPYVPAVGRLIIAHRIGHLKRELAFTTEVLPALRAEASWGSFLADRPIADFVASSHVPLEELPRPARARAGVTSPRRSRARVPR